MTGVFGLIDVGSIESDWIKADALVVGQNTTTFASTDQDPKLYYCARLEFISHFGENITAVSTTDCVLDQWAIQIGSYIPILYNPAYPMEIIEQEVLETELVSLKIMVGVGIAVSIILSAVLCLLLNRQSHRPPEMYVPNDWELTARPTESPEERKERILSKLYIVTVPEDSGKIAASGIRSMGKLDASEREKGDEIPADIESGNDKTDEKEKGNDGEEEKTQNNDDDEKGGNGDVNNDNLEPNQEDSTAAENKHQASGTMASFLSNWIRPNHDAECSICLDHYEPGEVVCASKSEECNHVFHKDCLMNWMMKNNDRCPLCRVDFMKDEEERAEE